MTTKSLLPETIVSPSPIGGILGKRVPDEADLFLDGATQAEAYETLAVIVYMLQYGQEFLIMPKAIRRVQEDYPTLCALANFVNPSSAKVNKMREKVQQLFDWEWRDVETNRQRLANKVFFEDFRFTDYLLGAAKRKVDEGAKEGISDALGVLRMRADLLGLQAPQRVEIGVEQKVELTDARRDALRAAAEEVLRNDQRLIAEASRLDEEREAMFAEDNIVEGEFVDLQDRDPD